MASVESGTTYLDQARAKRAVEPETGLRFTLASQLKLTAPKWLIRGCLEEDALALMFGIPASGKSFAALDMAASIASGKDWSGAETNAGPVLYLAGEGRAGITRRLTAWSIRNGIDRESLNLAVSNGPGRLCDLEGAIELGEAVDAFADAVGAPSLLVVDTLARSFGSGDESSNTDMSAVIAALDRIKSKHGCSILIVHHSGHNSQDRARGASALFAAVDTAIRVEQDEDSTVRTTWTKAKDTELPSPMAFKLRQVELPMTDDRGEALTSAVLDQVEYQEPAAAKRQGSGAQQTKALALLDKLQAEHETNVVADGRDRSDARVSIPDFREAMIDAGIPKQTASRMPRSLAQAGKAEIEGGFIHPM